MTGSELHGETALSVRHYFVDEAGDGILFNRRGRIIIGQEGCSRYFILGLLDVQNPNRLAQELSDLRTQLLADPYLKKVPSMQINARKTYLAFHAKDDCPEVRREVFRLIMKHEMRFFAVIRDKATVVEKVVEHCQKTPVYRYHPNQLYDRCVSRLFRDRLHKDDGYTIYFAKRGSRDRTDALQSALVQARNNFRTKWGVVATSPIELLATTPEKFPALQAADYILWALQRLYERREERYWEFVVPLVSLIHDVDDTRTNEYGEYYTKKNPLTAACIKNRLGI